MVLLLFLCPKTNFAKIKNSQSSKMVQNTREGWLGWGGGGVMGGEKGDLHRRKE